MYVVREEIETITVINVFDVNRATEIEYALDQITLREAVSQREESDTVHRDTWLIC